MHLSIFGVSYFVLYWQEFMSCVSLLKGALTNAKNKPRNTSCSAPELSPVLVSLSLQPPDSVARVGYLPFCFPSQILCFAREGFESLYRTGPSPLPLSREALVGGPCAAPQCMLVLQLQKPK